MLRKDGGVVYAEIVSMILEYDGRPNVIAFGRDLTERKQMQARLLLADRMVSVGTLAAGVAHEINNPLAYVMTNLDMVGGAAASTADGDGCASWAARPARSATSSTRVIAMIDVAREGSERMRDIVSDLRTFTRGDGRREAHRGGRAPRARREHQPGLERDPAPRAPREGVRRSTAHPRERGATGAGVPQHPGRTPRRRSRWATPRENVIRVRASTDRTGQVVVEVTRHRAGHPAGDPRPHLRPVLHDEARGRRAPGWGSGSARGSSRRSAAASPPRADPARGATFRVVLPVGDVGRAARPRAARSPVRCSAGIARFRLLVVDDEIAIGRTLAIALADEFEVVDGDERARGLDAAGRRAAVRRRAVRSDDARRERNGRLRAHRA